eukprot:TRINITY_DN3766_c0_g1_i3.p1 TRINITY_DN3766_c0_g1~~TRINITY_DN3766_c0_g1_i3.p1  ORF type:complete len:918 (-),score=213.98 TRINITY_DN3766_c0_g1_i3:84-2522(-)
MVSSLRSTKSYLNTRAATTGPNSAEVASFVWGRNVANNKTAYYNPTDAGAGGAMMMFDSYPADPVERKRIEDYVIAAGGGGMGMWQDSLSKGFTAAFRDSWPQISGMYWSGADDFTRIFPFADFSQIDMPNHVLEVDIFALANEQNDPERVPVWTTPYVDLISGSWVISLFAPVYNMYSEGDKMSGLCGFDFFFTIPIVYMDTLSNTLPWGAYAILVSNDGQLVAIPQKGSPDWSDDPNFNFANISTSPNFDASAWNIFTNPELESVGAPILEAQRDGKTSGRATVSIGGGTRVISWSQTGDGWIVVSVFDSEKELSAQRRAFISIVVAVVVLGVVVGAFATAAGIYTALRRQYAGLTNKIEDLNVKLAEAELRAGNLQLLAGTDAASVNALSSGIERITHTLNGIVANPTKPIDKQDIESLQTAARLLLRRDFQVVKTDVQLTENQKDFIHDCGIETEETKASAWSLDTANSGEAGQQLPPEIEMWEPTPLDVVVCNWDFDAFAVMKSLSSGGLSAVVHAALVEQRVIGSSDLLPIDIGKLAAFSSRLEAGYVATNPYHNAVHAADVTQAMHYMLTQAMRCCPKFAACLTPLDRLAAILAASMHDFQHVGRNNNFLKATMDKLHVHYIDSVLERMHAATSFELLLFTPECEALRLFSRSDVTYVHNLACTLILATDMARHVEILDLFKAWQSSGNGFSDDAQRTQAGKVLALQMLLKAADVSNAYREWDVCQRWTMALVREFLRQGEDEAKLGLPTSRFMDGSTKPEEMQDTFVPLMVVPILRALSTVFPDFDYFEKKAWDNLANWRQRKV